MTLRNHNYMCHAIHLETFSICLFLFFDVLHLAHEWHVCSLYDFFFEHHLESSFAERVRNKFNGKKKRDPAVIQTQDLLNTSQMLLPLSHLDP